MQTDPVKPAVEKIAHECEKAGATKWEAIRIIKELSAEEKTGSEQKLKEKALFILRSINPEAARVFESFARMHVHNSRQLIEQFDRGNIVKSLLQETHSNRAIAEKIGAEIEDKIKDLKIRHLTTSLIREMVNAKLLEYGLEDLRNKYARLGMPVADIEKEISNGLFENKEILMEYSLLVAIPETLSEQHFRADMHICNAEDFCTKPFGASILPNSRTGEEEKFIPELLMQIAKTKKFFSQPLNIESLNFSIATALAGAGEKKAKKTALFAFDCINSANCGESKKPTITLNFFVPESFEKNSAQKQKAIEIANAIIEAPAQKQGAKIVVAVDSKYCLKALNASAFEKEQVFVNCSKEELSSIGAQNVFPSQKCRGILGMVGLNAEKIALENFGKESAFEQAVLEKIIAAKKIIELKKTELEKRQYLKENNINIEEFRPALGIHNFQQAVEILLEKKETDKESALFCERMLKKIREPLGEEWIITRFAESEGKKRFDYFNEKKFRQQLDGLREGKEKTANAIALARNRKELEQAIETGEQLIILSPEPQMQT